jgi:hypothetical protein
LSACLPPNSGSRAAASISASARSCSSAPVQTPIQGFFSDWNERQTAIGALFSSQAELDMSTETEGASLSDKYTSLIGSAAISRFAAMEWQAGEVLSYSSITPFNGGAYVNSVSAKFNDGRKQTMLDAKFVYGHCGSVLDHVVIVAASPAA